MLIHIHNVLNATLLTQLQQELRAAAWVDGRATAGHLSAPVKHNQQLREDDPLAMKLGDAILAALEHNATFMSGALPAKVVPPLFNRHSAGETYGWHIDGSIRPVVGSRMRVRTDLSATLFLSNPSDYDGGELCIEDTFGVQKVKFAAGDMVLYPASSIHQVEPVSRGERIAAFFWIESMVRHEHQRRLLFNLDNSIQRLTAEQPQHPSVLELTALYHNLMREWASV